MGLSKAREKQTLFKFFELFCLFLFFCLFIRMYSFLGDTSLQQYNSILLLFIEAVAIVFCFGKMVSTYWFSFDSMQVSAVVFWLWSCFSTIKNANDVKDLLTDFVFQSFWMFIFLLFSVYLKKENDEKKIKFVLSLSLIFLLFTSIYYIYWALTKSTIALSGSINTIYYPLLLLPVVFTKRNKFLSVCAVVLLTFATLISEKRTALIALVLALVVPLIVNPNVRKKDKIKRLVLLLIVGGFLIALSAIFVFYFEIDIVDRFKNLANDGGSGRAQIYKTVWEHITNSDISETIIGKGYNGVAKEKIVMLVDSNAFGFEYTSAHNDFLEVIYDYGFVGFIMYVVFLLQMIKNLFKLYVNRSRYFNMTLSTVILYLVISTTSHLIIYPTYIVFLLMFMSIGLNRFGKEKRW